MSDRSDPPAADSDTAPYTAASSSDAHPRPSTLDALERSQLQHPLNERAQRSIWIGFFVVLGLLLALGIALTARHRAHGTKSTHAPAAHAVSARTPQNRG